MSETKRPRIPGLRWPRWPRSLTVTGCTGLVLLVGILVFVPGKSRIVVKPVEDLAQVPEVELSVNSFSGLTLPAFSDAVKGDLSAPLNQTLGHAVAAKKTAAAIARIDQLNTNSSDGFMEALRDERRDLAGLPYAMGDACRMVDARKQPFAAAVQAIRRAANTRHMGPDGAGFWEEYSKEPARRQAGGESALGAEVGALMQILMVESPAVQLGLVKYLSGLADVEATRALARLAVFAPEAKVGAAAGKALADRRVDDYRDVLVRGLRYPLPAVAHRAAEVVAGLGRAELVPELLNLLEGPDPRAPVQAKIDGKEVTVVHELVRLNHHKNCLLCHAPSSSGSTPPESLTAPVPLPTDPLDPPSDGYGMRRSPDGLLVRLDVTYLRQDFSVMQPVKGAAPWPEMQRFDYLVRAREVKANEAAAYRDTFGQWGPDNLSPYQKAALAGLREITGKDAGTTAEAWRQLLKLPAREAVALAR